MIRRALPGLALTSIILAGVTGLQLEATPSPRSATIPLALPPLTPTIGVTLASVSSAQVTDVLARPLFAPDRRPDPVRQSPAQAADASLPHLTGVLVSGFDRRAIFAGSDDGNAAKHGTVVREGDRIGPYRVQAITVSGVALSGPDGLRMVQLWYPGKPSAPPTPPPLVVAPFTMVPPALRDPARYNAPTGPFGMAMYRYSPAAPRRTMPAIPGASR